MKIHQIESWALDVIGCVETNRPIEDFRVELKSVWIPPEKAARRIAGHANAARGAPILWLIGVDKEDGIVGAEYEDLADWYGRVQSYFDGLAPRLADCNVPVKEDRTIVALLFETDRVPFVVKNPVFGKKGSGPVALEVPWREGTSTRSATRADLLRLLSPLQALPSFEVIGATLSVDSAGKERLRWLLKIVLYTSAPVGDVIIILFHRCEVACEILATGERLVFEEISLVPPYSTDRAGRSWTSLSKTIDFTKDEILIRGPGKCYLRAHLNTPTIPVIASSEVQTAASLNPTDTDHSVPLAATLTPRSPGKTCESYRWAFN